MSKTDYEARQKAKAEKMKNPEWHEYSGFPPERPKVDEKAKKKAKQSEPVATEPESNANGDGN